MSTTDNKQCTECANEMVLHNTKDDYNPHGNWQHYDYWVCHNCWYSEDAE